MHTQSGKSLWIALLAVICLLGLGVRGVTERKTPISHKLLRRHNRQPIATSDDLTFTADEMTVAQTRVFATINEQPSIAGFLVA